MAIVSESEFYVGRLSKKNQSKPTKQNKLML